MAGPGAGGQGGRGGGRGKMAGKGILEAEKSTQTTGGSKLFHTPGPAASADFRKLLYKFRLLLVEVGDPILVLQHNWRKAEGGGGGFWLWV